MITELTQSQWDTLLNAWREQNDAGHGEAFEFEYEEGEEYREPTVADVIDHPEVVLLAERGQQAIIQIATAGDPDRVLMVCNANGPWLCDVTDAWRAIS